MGQFILKRDNLKLGLVLGLLTPVIGILVFYLWRFSSYTFQEFWLNLQSNRNLVTSIAVICMFLNIVVFTLYINTRRDQTAKGVFIITVVFGIVALVFKFLG